MPVHAFVGHGVSNPIPSPQNAHLFTSAQLLQGACWEWFCGTNFVAAAPWLINRVFIIAICVILSYQIEREARQRYTVQQKLKYLCFKISEMDLDACQELLQDSATWDSMKMERQLLGLVQTLQRYKPFLPQVLWWCAVAIFVSGFCFQWGPSRWRWQCHDEPTAVGGQPPAVTRRLLGPGAPVQQHALVPIISLLCWAGSPSGRKGW